MAGIVAGGSSVTPQLFAQDSYVEFNTSDAIKQTMQQQVSKRIKLKLASGQGLDGKVVKVGQQAAVLSELAGREFYDAVVRLDQVSAVMIKMRTK
ncbi:MAG: hypothetical protein ACT4OO_07745 [Nitrospiraceae bacterium]